MNRTAILATLLALVLCASPGAAAPPADPLTFLVAFSGDSSRLVVASQRGGIRVLSVPDLQEVRSFALQNGRRFTSAVVSPSGHWLAADNDGDLLIWNLETGEAQPSVPLKPRSYPVYLFRPGADTLFVAYERKLHIWDVKEGRETGVVAGIDDIDRMSVSPDGRTLVAFGLCSSGRVRGNVCLYEIVEKKVVAAADWEKLFFESGKVGYWGPADLVYTDDDRILLTFSSSSSSQPATYESRFLRPADLTVLDNTLVEPERGWLYPGTRSAPSQQLEVVSPDGKWKVTTSVFMKRIFLYRVTADGGRVFEKFIPHP